MSEQGDFSRLVSDAVAAKMTGEFVEEAVNKRVDDLVKSAVDSALRSYSDTGRLIEEKVKESLKVGDLNLPSYGETVTKILKRQIESSVSELVAGRLSKDMEDLLSLAPKEIKLSKIVEKMVEESYEEYGECVTCIVEHTEYSSTWVYLDENAETDKYRCEIQALLRDDGSIGTASFRNKDLKPNNTIGSLYGLPQLFRAYYACGTKIIIDEEYVVTGKGDY